jgi:4-amino-4-deoxy-L-arabinose transferase-like glycosyltransferase
VPGASRGSSKGILDPRAASSLFADRSVARQAIEAGAVVALLAAAGVLFYRALALAPSFDEGVYVAQTDALAHGQRLGSEVFAAQPPGFHWLLLLGAKLGGVSVHVLRLEVLALALLGLLAAYAAARAVAGPTAGIAAAAVLAVAPPYPTYSVQVSADTPGTVLALCALACFFAAGRWKAVAGGALLAFAESVKLDAALLVAVPLLAVWLLERGRRRELLAAAAGAVTVVAVELAVLGSSLPDIWRGAVSYHLAARGTGGLSDNAQALRSFFHPQQPFTWLVIAALAVAVARRLWTTWPLWGGALLCALFLLWQHPLRDNHFVLLSVALAVPVGRSIGTVRAPVLLAAAGLIIVAGYGQEARRLSRNAAPVPAELRWAAAVIERRTSPRDLIVSDEPLVGPLAHRQLVGDLIDTAVLRFDSGYLSDDEVLAQLDRAQPAAVVAARAFAGRPRLMRALSSRYRAIRRDGVTVFFRPSL